MRTRISILLLLLSLAVGASADVTRGITFELSGAAGYSTLGYKAVQQDVPFDHSIKGTLGANAHLGAELFFTRYFGLGLGLDFTRYASRHTLSGTTGWTDVTDTDGERYNHTAQVNTLKETHQRLALSPQLMLVGQIPMGSLKLHLGVGLEYSLPLASDYKVKGDLTHTGFYPATNMTLHDVPNHGFYTAGKYEPNDKLDKGKAFAAVVARADLLIPLSKRWDLGLGILFKNAVAAQQEAGGEAAVGLREVKGTVSDEVWQAHQFMSNYESLSQTALTGGKYIPQLIAFNLSLRYTIPISGRPRICLCEF